MDKNITFIGGGNMASALIGGMIRNGWRASAIRVAEPICEQHARIKAISTDIELLTDNTAAIEGAEIVVLAVKPQVLREVCSSLQGIITEQQLVISIAAGIRSTDIGRWLGGEPSIVRCMPNTPSLVQSGATGLYANPRTSEEQRNLAETILRSVGTTLWVSDEQQIDAVTAVSGSGPAYFFLVIEAIEAAGIKLGLSEEQARLLSLETAFGAAKLALESEDDAATLRKRVTSPGGTTEAAISVLEANRLQNIFAEAITAAQNRATELADQLGADES
jgi:pyrroline-5-carboxylate reductase